MKATGQGAMTSNVNATEAKLIIELKKKLVEAKNLIDLDQAVKMRLIEGARDLKR